jgi:hypothetical protein
MRHAFARVLALAAFLGLGSAPAAAQNAAAAAGDSFYKPPASGAPDRRVAGVRRGTDASLPRVTLVAPDDGIAGETTSPAPDLYYFVSGPTAQPMRLTISRWLQPEPVLTLDLPSPRAAGIYQVRLGDHITKPLDRGVQYVWSVAIMVDRDRPSHNQVASATLLRVPPDPTLATRVGMAGPAARAAIYAKAGLWYDAVAAAAAAQDLDHHAALGRLLAAAHITDAATASR